MEKLIQEYKDACDRQTDINFHLPVLYIFANRVNHVTEFGVRDGQSTRALLAGCNVVRSYDLHMNETVEGLFNYAKLIGRDCEYIQGDSLSIDIEPTDLLFLDTEHTHPQLLGELERHHSKVSKYLCFHDTVTFGNPTGPDNRGLIAAVLEFLIAHPEWRVVYHSVENNGFTVLEKTIQ